jgi:hypothetical protein
VTIGRYTAIKHSPTGNTYSAVHRIYMPLLVALRHLSPYSFSPMQIFILRKGKELWAYCKKNWKINYELKISLNY